jgi:hypothetical protein
VIYLIDYDRKLGKLIAIEEYAESERDTARRKRLALERVSTAEGDQREIVMLEASSRAEVEFTHARYFRSLAELAAPFAERRTG